MLDHVNGIKWLFSKPKSSVYIICFLCSDWRDGLTTPSPVSSLQSQPKGVGLGQTETSGRPQLLTDRTVNQSALTVGAWGRGWESRVPALQKGGLPVPELCRRTGRWRWVTFIHTTETWRAITRDQNTFFLTILCSTANILQNERINLAAVSSYFTSISRINLMMFHIVF